MLRTEARPTASLPGPALGEHSRPVRFLVAAGVVAVYWTLGFLLRLDLAEYQLIGIPLLVAFQSGIQRQPLRTLWLRGGRPPRVDGWFLALWGLFSVVPARAAAVAAAHGAFALAGLYAAGVGGAFGLAYALRAMRAVTAGQAGLCLATAGVIALVPELLVLFGHMHIHINGAAAGGGTGARPKVGAGLQTLLWGLPAGFMIEEVFFRGGLDTYLHHGETGVGWLSAIYVSGLWGLWHLPAAAVRGPHLLSTLVQLLVAQIVVGVPLSLWWRRSGNLAVNNTTHAVIDAVRAML